MIEHSINKAFSMARSRGWDRIYIAVDVHDTMIIPNYRENDIPKEFFPYAAEAMYTISQRRDTVLILYTCSFPNEINQYLEFFKSVSIDFKYVNSNPEVLSSGYGCYDKKFYFNILIEDKAGFNPLVDWEIVLNMFKRQPLLLMASWPSGKA